MTQMLDQRLTPEWEETSPVPAFAIPFTRIEGWRIRGVAVALALASWSLPIAFVCLAFKPLRLFAASALILCVACLAVSLLLGWPLFCPWCCKRLFFVSSMANSPSLEQLFRLFVPREIVVNGRIMCPHCHSRFVLSRPDA